MAVNITKGITRYEIAQTRMRHSLIDNTDRLTRCYFGPGADSDQRLGSGEVAPWQTYAFSAVDKLGLLWLGYCQK